MPIYALDGGASLEITFALFDDYALRVYQRELTTRGGA